MEENIKDILDFLRLITFTVIFTSIFIVLDILGALK